MPELGPEHLNQLLTVRDMAQWDFLLDLNLIDPIFETSLLLCVQHLLLELSAPIDEAFKGGHRNIEYSSAKDGRFVPWTATKHKRKHLWRSEHSGSEMHPAFKSRDQGSDRSVCVFSIVGKGSCGPSMSGGCCC